MDDANRLVYLSPHECGSGPPFRRLPWLDELINSWEIGRTNKGQTLQRLAPLVVIRCGIESIAPFLNQLIVWPGIRLASRTAIIGEQGERPPTHESVLDLRLGSLCNLGQQPGISDLQGGEHEA